MIPHIQGLRGAAIISVLLFHLWPSWFPNGFIGVDVFFALSGYLMALIFAKEKTVSLSTAYEFYCRRVQRIFPLYYLIIPPIFICCHLFLSKGWILVNNQHSFYSILLLKNMETIWLKADYFKSFSVGAPQKDFFLHTWSLSVEIQFYLIVPLIFWILSHFSSQKHKIWTLTILSIPLCLYALVEDPTVAFNSTLARIPQFFVGMIAFLWGESLINNGYQKVNPFVDDKSKPSEAEEKSQMFNTLLVISLLVMVVPMQFDAYYMRPMVTIIVGYLLTVKNGGEFFEMVLQNKPITYIGNISYTMYLVHWPIILFMRSNNLFSYVIIIFYIFGASVFLFHYYESFYRGLSRKNVFLLTAGLFIFNLGLHSAVTLEPSVSKFVDGLRLSKLTPDLAKIVRRNEEMADVDFARTTRTECVMNATATAAHPVFSDQYWGVFDCPKGYGDKKLLVIGNCFANMQSDLIRKQFQGNYSEFKVITSYKLYVLFEYQDPDPRYHGQHNAALKLLDEFNPDYVFVAVRHEETEPITARNISDDFLVKQYNENVERIEAATNGRVFIQGTSPVYPRLHLNNYIDALITGDDLSPYHLNKKKAEDEMAPRQLRMDAIKCRKCQLYDTRSTFLEGDRYLGFDPNTLLSLADNSIHITDAGLERWRPIYANLIRSITV